MTHSLKRARESLRQTRNFVAGILIGAAFVTPVFAATDITLDDWTTLLLLGSVALLGIGFLLRIRAHSKTPTATHASAPQDLDDCIGQYRPQVYRP
jgi:hypothetical protein